MRLRRRKTLTCSMPDPPKPLAESFASVGAVLQFGPGSKSVGVMASCVRGVGYVPVGVAEGWHGATFVHVWGG